MKTENLTQAEDIIWRRIGDEVVVIKDDGLSTHVLNKTAAFIWELCDGKHDIAGITGKLVERFDVTEEVAAADINEVIGKLLKIGIVSEVGEQ